SNQDHQNTAPNKITLNTINQTTKNILPNTLTSTTNEKNADVSIDNNNKLLKLELLKSMIPFLPFNTSSFGINKTSKLLLEITQCVQNIDKKQSKAKFNFYDFPPGKKLV
ncbi:MAG: hypothetical protein VW602_07970, partial [Paracoccaceae bacterium]